MTGNCPGCGGGNVGELGGFTIIIKEERVKVRNHVFVCDDCRKCFRTQSEEASQ